MQIMMLPLPTYLVMLILDFLHRCSGVINQDRKHKEGFVTDGEHIFAEELFIVCAIARHIAFVIPNS